MKTRSGLFILVCMLLLALGGAATQVEYKDKPRTPLWVNEQYEYFKNKIVKVDGRFCDATSAVFAADHWGEDFSKYGFYSIRLSSDGELEGIGIRGNIRKGQTAILGGEVFQILDEKSLLVNRRTKKTFLIHLTEFPSTDGLIDGQPFPLDEKTSYPKPFPVVVIGTFRYETARGDMNTVPSVKPIGTLTKGEFEEALRQGMELEKWSTQTRPCPQCRGSKRKEKCRTCKRSGQVTKVIRTAIE